MKKYIVYLLLSGIGLVALFFMYFVLSRQVKSLAELKRAVFEATHSRDKVAENEAFTIAYNAYLYGFVRVKGLLLQQRATHPKYRDYAPVNQFAISEELAKPGFTDFTPNCDTYYGLAWLDLSKGPILMLIPEVSSKYWTIQATDVALNTFNYIGSRLHSKPGKWAYCRKDWQGELPDDVLRIDCPSNQVFLQARNLVIPGDKHDEKATYQLMSKYRLWPLDSTTRYPAIDSKSEMVNPLNTNPDLLSLNFFKLLNHALKKDPPYPQDEGLVATFARLGIGKDQIFDESKLNKAQIKGMKKGIMAAFRKLYDELKFGGERLGGFNFRYDLGYYQYNYTLSAAVAFYGYGANTAEEALYPSTIIDADGRELNGRHRYRLHFTKEQLPPVHAFWSITMYSRPDNQLIENAIHRYNIGGLTPGLKFNQDGSLDIVIQQERPSDISNWLPAPNGDFWLILRMYHPTEKLLHKKYKAPYVVKI